MLPLIAILRGVNPSRVISIAQLLVDRGFQMIEVPLNGKNAVESIQLMCSHSFGMANEEHSHRPMFGAGTVTTVSDAAMAIEAGAEFIVSPNTNPALIRFCKDNDVLVCSGVFTPTEAFQALEAGADILKIFPVNVMGIDGFKALRSILPSETKCFPVGGITLSSDCFQSFIAAGADGFGLGSSLFTPDMSDMLISQNAQKSIDLWEQYTTT
ncbi:2-dehydro-3-deoxy-6-phosphogalactonate aldolase [Glaciecola sp. MH2013]|uniref:2-dehydro-3-deoxy-6-phosphogalactonate aldolase n=1 Tax=Glaciecola sp. MH2013 TaxID=2785524 RepID=UPI00189CEFD3|nr:2-dehydro-3-deoxy-6-phosphogalactonate aldolase [Glaciecola sp. MH2013]MBF7072296.1 2-dehydro-3-deoxy-6-phosphogalactonate aldolase [Glaciecola sp. MH2013]